jgi:hypothetical protein
MEPPITFYWPNWSRVATDGTITLKVTGYEGDCHWTGQHVSKPDDPTAV